MRRAAKGAVGVARVRALLVAQAKELIHKELLEEAVKEVTRIVNRFAQVEHRAMDPAIVREITLAILRTQDAALNLCVNAAYAAAESVSQAFGVKWPPRKGKAPRVKAKEETK